MRNQTFPPRIVIYHINNVVKQWLALSPHSKKALGSNPGRPGHSRSFLCGVCMFSSCLRGFTPGTPVSPTIIKTCTAASPRFVWMWMNFGGGRRGRRRRLAATLPSICPRAAVATDAAYHHWYDCVCMNTGLWTVKRLRVSWEALYKINDYYYYRCLVGLLGTSCMWQWINNVAQNWSYWYWSRKFHSSGLEGRP